MEEIAKSGLLVVLGAIVLGVLALFVFMGLFLDEGPASSPLDQQPARKEPSLAPLVFIVLLVLAGTLSYFGPGALW